MRKCIICIYINNVNKKEKPLCTYLKHNYIALLNDIILTLQTKKSFLSRLRPTTRIDKFLHTDHFCFDKFFFKVRMNHSRSLRRACSFFNCPCACFFFSCREVVHESEGIECESDHIVKCRDIFTRMHIIDELFSLLCRKSEHL